MKTRVIIDQAGSIAIPVSLREELRLEPGDALEIECHGEEIVLRPVPDNPTLTREHGVWVLNTGEPLPASADDLRAKIYEEREKKSF
jgi:AbrB family looped-hinge helix DNA binding protein